MAEPSLVRTELDLEPIKQLLSYPWNLQLGVTEVAWKLIAEIEHLRAVLASLGDQMWQPIETCPKDCDVLIWDDYGVDTATWGGIQDSEFHPTHWMPLPAPPVSVMTPQGDLT